MSQTSLVSPDTDLEAARVYFATLKRLGGSRRMEMGAELSNQLRARLEAGVRHRHPEYRDHEVRLAVLRLMVGDTLFRQCSGECDVEP